MTKSTGGIPRYPTIKVDLSGDDKYCPVSELNDYIHKCSEPSFDRWANRARMFLEQIVITRPLLESMIEFLNLPFAQDPTGTDDREFRWIEVLINDSEFANHRNTPDRMYDEDYCSLDDIHRLFSVISHRAVEVSINRCPAIVSCFLSFRHHIHFEADHLNIDQTEELSCRDYATLGDMIRRSIHLRELDLRLPFRDGAHELLAGLANSIDLQELSLADAWKRKFQRNDLSDIAVGGKGVNGPVICLLQNPQNQLKKLSLFNMGLKDDHLIALLQVILTSHVEMLNFSYNLIQLQGMLEFANLLPRMRSLKQVSFGSNPWEDTRAAVEDRNKVGAALLKGMMENLSIETVNGIARTPQAPLLWHCVALNRAGRRILTSSPPIADGLWPRVLERAGSTLWYWGYNLVALDMGDKREYNGNANAVYYFLQSCPRILSFR